MTATVVVLGIFAADLVFEAPRLPAIGETLLGERFRIGPGGKGSNQAVAAARAGGTVSLIARLGTDTFADIAMATWADAGVDTRHVVRDAGRPSGTAFIFVASGSGDNAIIVTPGASGALIREDVVAATATIRGARVFLTQLELPVAVTTEGLRIARDAGVTTILNPAPAIPLDAPLLALCDVVTPNESEAALLTGRPVTTVENAAVAASTLIRRGARAAVITLGGQGALLHDGRSAMHVPAFRAGPTIDTTGAGDAFAGALAVALGEGRPLPDAVRFGCAAAAISVTRPGTAPSMPARGEIDALLADR